MTRGARRWIRTAAVAAICANVAMLYAAQPARAASFCSPTVTACELSGTCFFNQQQRLAICEGVCQNAGGSSCHANPNLPVQCGVLNCPPNHDELFCHCET